MFSSKRSMILIRTALINNFNNFLRFEWSPTLKPSISTSTRRWRISFTFIKLFLLCWFIHFFMILYSYVDQCLLDIVWEFLLCFVLIFIYFYACFYIFSLWYWNILGNDMWDFFAVFFNIIIIIVENYIMILILFCFWIIYKKCYFT